MSAPPTAEAACYRPPAPTPIRLEPLRCPKCGGMLARVALGPGSVVEIKCGKCNTMTTKAAA